MHYRQIIILLVSCLVALGIYGLTLPSDRVSSSPSIPV